jgi:hypothetical protein
MPPFLWRSSDWLGGRNPPPQFADRGGAFQAPSLPFYGAPLIGLADGIRRHNSLIVAALSKRHASTFYGAPLIGLADGIRRHNSLIVEALSKRHASTFMALL